MDVIPEFEQREGYPFALLPEGVYPCDAVAFRSHFVERFPGSRTRRVICDGFLQLRHEAVGHGIGATQWVDGSFVERKPDPGDVDVVSFCDYDWLNQLGSASQEAVLQLLNGGAATKARYHTHTFLVPACGMGHPYFPQFEAARQYWRTWFGRTRPLANPAGPPHPGHAKGFLQMPLGEAGPDVSTARSPS